MGGRTYVAVLGLGFLPACVALWGCALDRIGEEDTSTDATVPAIDGGPEASNRMPSPDADDHAAPDSGTDAISALDAGLDARSDAPNDGPDDAPSDGPDAACSGHFCPGTTTCSPGTNCADCDGGALQNSYCRSSHMCTTECASCATEMTACFDCGGDGGLDAAVGTCRTLADCQARAVDAGALCPCGAGPRNSCPGMNQVCSGMNGAQLCLACGENGAGLMTDGQPCDNVMPPKKCDVTTGLCTKP